jgi:holin-like protein
MNIIKGIFVILLHLVLGNLLSSLIGGFVPGSVLGMILLFGSLMTGLVKEDSVRDVAAFLTDNMALFFIPALIGILDMWGLIKVHFWGWLILLTLTAVIVMAVSGWTKQLTDKIWRKK